MAREELVHMTIVCGFDFSEASMKAAEVAVGIAARLKSPVLLVHALGDWPGEMIADEKGRLLSYTRSILDEQANKLRGRGAEIQVRVELEAPEKSLIGIAGEVGASTIVVGATGRGRAGGQSVGRTADRIAQQSRIPALVVRAAEPFMRWIKGDRPLRVAVGLDFNAISEDAWRWAADLSRVGPVALVGAHVYWPPHQFARLGLSGLRSYVDADPEVESVLQRELQARFEAPDQTSVRFRTEPSLGRPADHLLAIASDEKVDLVVVGSHQRSAINQIWEGSVSRGVLHYSLSSVACIPLRGTRAGRASPEVRTALVATDFSEVGNAAIDYAFGQVGPGGKVYLVHVLEPIEVRSDIDARDVFKVSPSLAAAKKTAEDKLRGLVPLRALIHDRQVEVLVLEARNPAEALAQAAERVGADVICLGTHGRKGLSKAVFGSVAQAVLEKTERPVLLVRAPKA
jgi:nucleotide-binding universal stress UspA family protein